MAFMASSIFKLISLVLLSHFHGFSIATNYNLNSSQSIGDDGKTSLVSKEGNFELGFFNTQGNPNRRFVGIWYKKIPIRTVVWVANRCDPILGSSGSLTIDSTGDLVLLNRNKSVVWSTNSSRRANRPIVELLDSGNLVLRDEDEMNTEDNYLWQSFDHPSDTLMAGMKMGWDLKRGIKRRISAWRNIDDPCPGDFTYGIEFDPKLHTFPEAYVRKSSSKFYRTGPFNGLRFSGSPELKPNPLYGFYFVYDEEEVYYMYDLKNASIISRIVLNQTTSVRERLTWVESDQTWRAYSTVPRDQCDMYGICGANGNCVIGDNPVCHCLKGFVPKSQGKWDSMDWSDGCVRNKPLTCLGGKDKGGFAKFSGLKLPDTTSSWVNKTMNLKECKIKCLSNCSCTAYTNSNITGKGSGCAIWFGDLFDIREFPSGGQDLFIRLSNSELDKGEAKKKVLVIISSIAGFCGIAILSLLYCIFKSRGFQDTKSETILLESDEEEDIGLPLFNLSTISKATDNFSSNNKLGEGGFGQVYRGELEGGREIAVKRLSINSGQGIAELKNEVRLIAKLQHRNLVKLLGCCIQGEEKTLIYEYMSNKSLDYFIFDQERQKLLHWSLRFKIICGIARGLVYLHQDSRLRVIHRDLKASNILLDNDMNPKISDFGLARSLGGDQTQDNTNRVLGTHGYIAPEYAFDGLFSTKSDVFSFGILVLEIISGKRSRGFHMENHLTLIGHAWTLHNEESSFQFIDECQNIISEKTWQEVLRCIQIGLLCVQQNPADRPDMSSVVLMLSSECDLPRPKPPGYFIDMDFGKVDHYSSSKPESCSTNEMSMSQLEAR